MKRLLVLSLLFVRAIVCLGRLLCQIVMLPFRYWKTVAILMLSGINIVSFLAAANTEAILAFEYQRLVAVDRAQRFAYRALGIAEMETMRASDLEDRLELERALNVQLQAQLQAQLEAAAGPLP